MVLGSCEGLANKSVTSSCLPITFTSKKFIFCLKYSAGDFSGVWKVFNLLIIFSRDSYSCSKIKNTLSVYAHCAIGFSSKGFKIFFLSQSNRIAFGGANIPISVPHISLKLFLSNLKMFQYYFSKFYNCVTWVWFVILSLWYWQKKLEFFPTSSYTSLS